MIKKPTARSQKPVARIRNAFLHVATGYKLPATSSPGMTLVETLVAVSILTVAIVAPMTLTMQSLSAAYYARDQVIASNLAQEAIESVRAVRDANILILALGVSDTCIADVGSPPMHLMCGIPIDEPFTIDARTDPPDIERCSGECAKLKTDNNLYGHDNAWTIETPFRRTVHAEYVSGGTDEIRVTVTVTRENAVRDAPPVVLHENLYRWVPDGSDD